MEKTIKEMAQELGLTKQQVYRFVKKNCINEVHQEAHQSGGVKRYDETAQQLVREHFCKKEVHQNHINEVHQNHINDAVSGELRQAYEARIAAQAREIERLHEELEAERAHSRELADKLAVLADQAQRLQLASMPKQLEADNDRPSLWRRIFG